MRQLAIVALVLGFVVPAPLARADEAADPTGMWQWTFPGRAAWPDSAVSLQLDGNKVTGFAISNVGGERPISHGSYRNGTISFQVRLGFSTYAYAGKLSGDTIKGQIKLEGKSLTQTRPWKAVRVDSRDPSGAWENTVSANGKTWVTRVQFQVDGEKLSGTITPSKGPAQTIEEGQFKDGKLTFVERETRGEKEIVRHYTVYLLGDTLLGQTRVGGGGGPFKATRVKE